MTILHNSPPQRAYGILDQDAWELPLDLAADQIRRLGYAIVDSGFSAQEIHQIAHAFDETRSQYVEKWGEAYLESLKEHHSIRLPMALSPATFRTLAFNETVVSLVRKLIRGQFILTQQNGVINPPGEGYSQGLWHRDLPYQHFRSTTPLAVNALYCVDDFTHLNGSTWVLPASHKSDAFPSAGYIEQNAIQVTAKAGQYIVLDCMLYHAGGENTSAFERRAVNHVYSIPFFSQQIRIPGNVAEEGLTCDQRKLLGFEFSTPQSVEEFLFSRAGK